VPQQNNV